MYVVVCSLYLASKHRPQILEFDQEVTRPIVPRFSVPLVANRANEPLNWPAAERSL